MVRSKCDWVFKFHNFIFISNCRAIFCFVHYILNHRIRDSYEFSHCILETYNLGAFIRTWNQRNGAYVKYSVSRKLFRIFEESVNVKSKNLFELGFESKYCDNFQFWKYPFNMGAVLDMRIHSILWSLSINIQQNSNFIRHIFAFGFVSRSISGIGFCICRQKQMNWLIFTYLKYIWILLNRKAEE